MKTAVVITGVSGGIGSALADAFTAAGHHVIGLDRVGQAAASAADFLSCDLLRLCEDADYRTQILAVLSERLAGYQLHALVNNAAAQVLGKTEAVSLQDWNAVMSVNVTAAFLLTQGLLSALEAASGSVINICSIHASQTKPGFVAYATSKAALAGLTRALAVDLGGRVRVNGIAPAAIATPMLKAGFDKNPAGLEQLAAWHPTGRIGEPGEVATLAVAISDQSLPFLSGSVIDLNGGIGGRLHDPD